MLFLYITNRTDKKATVNEGGILYVENISYFSIENIKQMLDIITSKLKHVDHFFSLLKVQNKYTK